MAQVRRATNKLTAPIVKLRGRRYIDTTSQTLANPSPKVDYGNERGFLQGATTTVTYQNGVDTQRTTRGVSISSFDGRAMQAFLGPVKFWIVPDVDSHNDPMYRAYSRRYTNPYGGKNFVGKARTTVNPRWEYGTTYYTLNGKDPTRTNSYIWKGSKIVLENNIFSNDKSVIKVKSYQAGRESVITKVVFRIIVPRARKRQYYNVGLNCQGAGLQGA